MDSDLFVYILLKVFYWFLIIKSQEYHAALILTQSFIVIII